MIELPIENSSPSLLESFFNKPLDDRLDSCQKTINIALHILTLFIPFIIYQFYHLSSYRLENHQIEVNPQGFYPTNSPSNLVKSNHIASSFISPQAKAIFQERLRLDIGRENVEEEELALDRETFISGLQAAISNEDIPLINLCTQHPRYDETNYGVFAPGEYPTPFAISYAIVQHKLSVLEFFLNKEWEDFSSGKEEFKLMLKEAIGIACSDSFYRYENAGECLEKIFSHAMMSRVFNNQIENYLIFLTDVLTKNYISDVIIEKCLSIPLVIDQKNEAYNYLFNFLDSPNEDVGPLLIEAVERVLYLINKMIEESGKTNLNVFANETL